MSKKSKTTKPELGMRVALKSGGEGSIMAVEGYTLTVQMDDGAVLPDVDLRDTAPLGMPDGPCVGRRVIIDKTGNHGQITKLSRTGKLQVMGDNGRQYQWLPEDEVSPEPKTKAPKSKLARDMQTLVDAGGSKSPLVPVQGNQVEDRLRKRLEEAMAEVKALKGTIREQKVKIGKQQAASNKLKSQAKDLGRMRDIIGPGFEGPAKQVKKSLKGLVKAAKVQKKSMGEHLSLNLKCTGCKWLNVKGPGFAKPCTNLGKKTTSPACEAYDPHNVLLNNDFEAIKKVGKTIRHARDDDARDDGQLPYMVAYALANSAKIPVASGRIGLDLQFGDKVYVNLSSLVASNIEDSDYLNCWFEATVYGVSARNQGLILFTKFEGRYIHTIKVLREGTILTPKMFEKKRKALIKANRIDAPMKTIKTNFPSLKATGGKAKSNKNMKAIGKAVEANMPLSKELEAATEKMRKSLAKSGGKTLTVS